MRLLFYYTEQNLIGRRQVGVHRRGRVPNPRPLQPLLRPQHCPLLRPGHCRRPSTVFIIFYVWYGQRDLKKYFYRTIFDIKNKNKILFFSSGYQEHLQGGGDIRELRTHLLPLAQGGQAV